MTLLPCRPAHITGSSQRQSVKPSLIKQRGIFEKDKLEHIKCLLVELNPQWFRDGTYSKMAHSTLEKETHVDDQDADLEVPEEQLHEIEKTLTQFPSDGLLQDSAVEAAKEARIWQVLDTERHLAEHPDVILEIDKDELHKAEYTRLCAPFQGLSRKPSSPRTRNIIVSEPVFKTRMQLLNGGRHFNGCSRGDQRIDIYLPINIIGFLVRAELNANERHPHCWAQKALDSDTGARLAISVTREEDGESITTYATNNGSWAPYKANTFVDWLNGIDYIQISQSPRRYLHFQP
ncbi:hypothetical protein BO78DRAFT_404226 [Aspergillus sclerotiicarbonarius CBS 121057]|uniref:Uncharacterized protein n=1 Tax=Aspergillus sclerotiicarbonarius (strain CBS 121057 / IBT 28362) TaxID=1448318 RepID=A0A319EZ79_ASPSB|nr:hypothetical protein BO78DRAFT_404226 [Aspergillus sclerotiicarbonarius CBS 121057]